MPRTARAAGLDQLLDTQFCVASREQLRCLGLKDNAMQYRVRADGPWQTLLPGVYLAVSGGTNLLQKEMAALLYAGPGSVITGPAALTARQLTSLRDVRAVVADAVQLDRCTVSQLGVELTNGPTQGSAMFRSVLAEVADGIRSAAEGDLRDLITAAALLRREPAKVAQTIQRALERGRMRPALPIRTDPCPTAKAEDSVDVAPYPIDAVERHID